MDLHFERGDAATPRGHALIYFENRARADETVATYLVVLPISIELSKYVPPMLAARLPLGEIKSLAAVPLPPIPEAVESRAFVRHLAELRDDDLIDGGSIDVGDLERSVALTGEIAQTYHTLYEAGLRARPVPAAEPEPTTSLDVNDVLYNLLSEQQKLAELAKLAGQLRYAVNGNDQKQVAEISADMEHLGRYLPAKYQVDQFIAAARQNGERGQHLAELYLERCFRLANEDYAAVAESDHSIERLRNL